MNIRRCCDSILASSPYTEMSEICKFNVYNWEQPHMFSSLEEDFFSSIKIPSLSSVSITDSNNSDLSMEKDILGDISTSDQCAFEFGLIECHESKLKTLSDSNKNGHSTANTACDQLNRFQNIDSKSLCTDNSLKKEHKRKSVSLHDVTNLPSSLLNSNTGNGVSSETLHSHSVSSTVKSKDSGIHRSVSCLSLTSGNRSYDHVQSKVKQYIQNIKESEAQRKKNRIKFVPVETPLPAPVVSNFEEPEKLKKKICELEYELKEKSILLDTQQVQYNALLYKYAEAKNLIDSIRLKRMSINYNSTLGDDLSSVHFMNSSNSFHVDSTNLSNNFVNGTTANNKEADGNLNAESNFNNTVSDSSAIIFPKHSTPLTSPNQIKNMLGPVSSIFSSSSRLDKQFVPLSKCDRNSNENKSQLWESISQGQEPCIIKSPEAVNVCFAAKKSSVLSKSHTLKQESIQHIDLPKDAPFDKVKKWQESLPSIDLLGTCSTSNSDISDTSLINHCDLNSAHSSESVPDTQYGQFITSAIQETQTTKSNIQKECPRKSIEHGFSNELNTVKYYSSSCSFNLDGKQSSNSQSLKVTEERLSLPLSKLSINGGNKYYKTPKSKCDKQNNNIFNISCKTNCRSCEKLNDKLSNCKLTNEESLLAQSIQNKRVSKLHLTKQESEKMFKNNTRISVVSVDETTSDDELSSYFPNSVSSALSVDNKLKQLVKSEDSSSVSSSVLDSINVFDSFVQKKSPKRKVNCFNCYTPSKIPKIKETSHPSCVVESSVFKQNPDVPPKILRESRLNHLFSTDNRKITQTFQSVDNSEDSILWKNNAHTQFKKSKNLQECLKHAEYFVNILSEGLKEIESTLDKPTKVQ